MGGARDERPDQLRQDRGLTVPLYLSERDVQALVTPAVAIEAVEACFDRLARGVVADRPRQRVGLDDGAFAGMHAAGAGLGDAGGKSYVWLPRGAAVGGVLVLVDPPAPPAGVGGPRPR